LPTLVIVGDEDEPCIAPSLYLKTHIGPCGLAMFAKSGHTVNLEEPALFNDTVADFIARAEAGRWPARDPRSRRPTLAAAR
jgi:proline iminopeptidase